MAIFESQKRGKNVANSVVIVVILLVVLAGIFVPIGPFKGC
jgi:hypothetical protein